MKTLPIFSLEGKVVMVVGATSGLGRALAVAAAGSGATVLGIGRDEERIAGLQAELDRTGGRHRIEKFDVLELDAIGGLIGRLTGEFGKIHGFVHCAGIPLIMPVRGMNARYYKKIFDLNFVSQMEFIRHIFTNADHCCDGGSVVLMSSVASQVGAIGNTAYSASKGALNAAMHPLAMELAPRRIRVNAVLPGLLTDTAMGALSNLLPSATFEHMRARYLLGFGKVEDIVGTLIFLLSDASSWMTGSELVVAGGHGI